MVFLCSILIDCLNNWCYLPFLLVTYSSFTLLIDLNFGVFHNLFRKMYRWILFPSYCLIFLPLFLIKCPINFFLRSQFMLYINLHCFHFSENLFFSYFFCPQSSKYSSLAQYFKSFSFSLLDIPNVFSS